MERRDKKRIIYLCFGLIVSVIGTIGLCYLLGWKITVCLFLVLWGNNISASDTFKK